MKSERLYFPRNNNNNGYEILDDLEIEYSRELCNTKYPIKVLEMLASQAKSFQEKKVAFVSLQHNSQNILPYLIDAILQTIHYMGGNSNENVFVSFLESNSKDNTVQILKDFEDKLNQLGIKNSIKTNDNSVNPAFIAGCQGGNCRNRIDYLARLRNVAMAPILALKDKESKKFDTIVFINDVMLCGGDILRLLARSTIDSADMVCGYDFQDKIFWDNWVYEDMERIDRATDERNKRDIILDSNLHPKTPLPLTESSMETPESVFCCWNGMTAINMDVFYNGVRFRRGMIELGTDLDCSQSEASLLCLDMRKLGYNKIIADPTVQVFYDTTARDLFFRYTSEENSKSVAPMKYNAYNNKRETWRCCELQGNGQTHIDWGQCRQQRLDVLISNDAVHNRIQNSVMQEARDILLYTADQWDDVDSNSWRFPYGVYAGGGAPFAIYERSFSTISNEQKIPKVIFQTCKSYHNAPESVVDLVNTWSKLNPTYRHYVLDDGAAAKFILKHYNDTVLKAFRGVPLGVMRGDMIRYMLIYQYGGIYADVDTRAKTSIDEWTPAGCNFVIGIENDKHFLQWAFASVPKHPILKSVIDLVLDRVIHRKYDPATNEHFVHDTTGPAVWTEAIHNYMRCKGAPDTGTFTGQPVEGTDVCMYSRNDMDKMFENIYMSQVGDLSIDGTSGLWNSWTKEREVLVNQLKIEQHRNKDNAFGKHEDKHIDNDKQLSRKHSNKLGLDCFTPQESYEKQPSTLDSSSSTKKSNYGDNDRLATNGPLNTFYLFLFESLFFVWFCGLVYWKKHCKSR